ncbi:MAG TPA: TonB family protein [Terriglobales bacterium]
MNEEWKQWEGRTVDGIFPLRRYLGGSDHSAVFLTDRQSGAGESESAAIKLIAAEADAENQLARGRVARKLDHPNLIRIFDVGRSDLDGVALLYVLEEYAEENLAQILPERALTAEEVRMMLPPVLGALQYVHGKGLRHGRIQPSNILAVGDEVKLSSDSVGAAGKMKGAASIYDPPEAATGADSAASDVWRLGMTLVEVLTQRLPDWDRSQPGAPEIPAAVPEPFREIAGRCLQVDPAQRWTIAEIAARLQTSQSAGGAALAQAHAMTAVANVAGRENVERRHLSQPSKSATWPYVLLLAVVVVVIVFLMTRAKTTGNINRTPAESSATQTAPSSTQPESQQAGGGERPTSGGDNGIVHRVMPEISPSARSTIRGTIKIGVRVDVDAAGNVTSARIASGGGSKYFSRVALEAAREWKFSPSPDAAGARAWKLQFTLSRSRMEASAARVKR